MKTWGQANRALGLLAGIERRIARHKADAERLEARRAKWAERLEAFVRAHVDEMEGRSRALPHGEVGLHKGWKLLVARGLMKRLLDRGLEAYINRPKPKVNKAALKVAPEDVLRDLGCRLEDEDVFRYEAR